jgi:hypothetical protein
MNQSTVSISDESFSPTAKSVQVDSGHWEPYDEPEKYMETAIAKALKSEGKQEALGIRMAQPAARTSKSSLSRHVPAASIVADPDPAAAVGVGKKAASESASIKQNDKAIDGEVASVIPVQEVDEREVMKCFGDAKLSGSGIVLHLVDFGGQAVFNVLHHLFITRYAVYLLTFNMEWLAQAGGEREMCLRNLAFWMNSIFIHTAHILEGRKQTARVVFVGTRKDLVREPAVHEGISALLEEKFGRNPVWRRRIENEDGRGRDGHVRLNFFPVDNTLGHHDISIATLMRQLEGMLMDDPVVQQHKPLTWLQTIDKLVALRQPFLTLEEAENIATSTGIPAEEVSNLLHFLHEMGTVMWHDEEMLRNIVILDPIKYFVEPVTRLICKHRAQDGTGQQRDYSVHYEKWHKDCQDYDYDKWLELKEEGLLHDSILQVLLSDIDSSRKLFLTRLMVKIGLIVRLIAQTAAEVDEVKYLVPALLPRSGRDNEHDLEMSGAVSTCFIVFTISKKVMDQEVMSVQDLESKCFLPSGLFSRLVGKAAQLHNQTPKYAHTPQLFAETAVLYYGSQRFKLTLQDSRNSIRLDVEGHPRPVLNRICNQLASIINECFHSLQYFVVLEHLPPQATDPVFIHLERVQLACADITLQDSQTGLRAVRFGSWRLDSRRLEELYGPWVRRRELLPLYHIFFSYRWGEDSEFVTRCNDSLLEETVGAQHRAVEVFQDVQRLQSGTNFLEGFEDALISSLVVVPVMSRWALKRMMKHDPKKEDFTLIEWILACQCFYINSAAGFKHPVVRVQRVLPMVFENMDPMIERMAEVIPETSWLKAEEALGKRGLEAVFSRCTVKALMKDHLQKFLQCSCNERDVHFEPDRVRLGAAVATCNAEVCKVLNDLNVDQYHRDEDEMQVSGKAPTSPSAKSPVFGCEAWAILTNRNQHLNSDALAELLNDLGVLNEASLMKCSRAAIDSIAAMLKPISKKEFMLAVKETWEVNKAWDILHNEKQVRNREGLAVILEEQGIEEAEYLAHLTEEVLTEIAQCLKPVAGSLFKQAMNL